jgi:hypothetical protein
MSKSPASAAVLRMPALVGLALVIAALITAHPK